MLLYGKENGPLSLGETEDRCVFQGRTLKFLAQGARPLVDAVEMILSVVSFFLVGIFIKHPRKVADERDDDQYSRG